MKSTVSPSKVKGRQGKTSSPASKKRSPLRTPPRLRSSSSSSSSSSSPSASSKRQKLDTTMTLREEKKEDSSKHMEGTSDTVVNIADSTVDQTLSQLESEYTSLPQATRTEESRDKLDEDNNDDDDEEEEDEDEDTFSHSLDPSDEGAFMVSSPSRLDSNSPYQPVGPELTNQLKKKKKPKNPVPLKICDNCSTQAVLHKAKKCHNCGKFFYDHWAKRCRIPPCPRCHFSRRSGGIKNLPTHCERCNHPLSISPISSSSPPIDESSSPEELHPPESLPEKGDGTSSPLELTDKLTDTDSAAAVSVTPSLPSADSCAPFPAPLSCPIPSVGYSSTDEDKNSATKPSPPSPPPLTQDSTLPSTPALPPSSKPEVTTCKSDQKMSQKNDNSKELAMEGLHNKLKFYKSSLSSSSFSTPEDTESSQSQSAGVTLLKRKLGLAESPSPGETSATPPSHMPLFDTLGKKSAFVSTPLTSPGMVAPVPLVSASGAGTRHRNSPPVAGSAPSLTSPLLEYAQSISARVCIPEEIKPDKKSKPKAPAKSRNYSPYKAKGKASAAKDSPSQTAATPTTSASTSGLVSSETKSSREKSSSESSKPAVTLSSPPPVPPSLPPQPPALIPAKRSASPTDDTPAAKHSREESMIAHSAGDIAHEDSRLNSSGLAQPYHPPPPSLYKTTPPIISNILQAIPAHTSGGVTAIRLPTAVSHSSHTPIPPRAVLLPTTQMLPMSSFSRGQPPLLLQPQHKYKIASSRIISQDRLPSSYSAPCNASSSSVYSHVDSARHNIPPLVKVDSVGMPLSQPHQIHSPTELWMHSGHQHYTSANSSSSSKPLATHTTVIVDPTKQKPRDVSTTATPAQEPLDIYNNSLTQEPVMASSTQQLGQGQSEVTGTVPATCSSHMPTVERVEATLEQNDPSGTISTERATEPQAPQQDVAAPRKKKRKQQIEMMEEITGSPIKLEPALWRKKRKKHKLKHKLKFKDTLERRNLIEKVTSRSRRDAVPVEKKVISQQKERQVPSKQKEEATSGQKGHVTSRQKEEEATSEQKETFRQKEEEATSVQKETFRVKEEATSVQKERHLTSRQKEEVTSGQKERHVTSRQKEEVTSGQKERQALSRQKEKEKSSINQESSRPQNTQEIASSCKDEKVISRQKEPEETLNQMDDDSQDSDNEDSTEDEDSEGNTYNSRPANIMSE